MRADLHRRRHERSPSREERPPRPRPQEPKLRFNAMERRPFHRRDRYRSSSDESSSRELRRNERRLPIVGKEYDGTILHVKNFGCFVSLDGFQGEQPWLCHKSELEPTRECPTTLYDRGQRVRVRVISVANPKRVSLSMLKVRQPPQPRDVNVPAYRLQRTSSVSPFRHRREEEESR